MNARSLALVAWVSVFCGCTSSNASSSSSSSSSSGGGGALDASVPDAAVPDAGFNPFVEVEPNNGAAAGDVNAVILPARGTGVVDPADDLDILSVTLQGGTLVTWTLTAGAPSVLAPHLAITEDGDHVPHLVSSGSVGGTATQEHFVLQGATYYVIVRDARNVPASSSAHQGSASHAWQLQARVTPRQHTAATFPSTVDGTLATRTSANTYAFTAATAFSFDVVLNAVRKTPPSNMDSRLSLYDATHDTFVLANDDDVAAGTTDSHVGGMLPAAGDYVVVVENVDAAATDLGYQLVFSLR